MSDIAGFERVPLRRLFTVVNGSTPDSQNGEYWGGAIPWVTPEDLSDRGDRGIVASKRTLTDSGYASCGTSLVPPGSIVISTRAPIGNLGIADVPLCFNQGCRALVPSPGIEPRFYFYALSVSTQELNHRGRGTTFLELSSNELAGFKVPRPRLEQQQQIANFLDERTARIDALIEEKERLIAFLNDARESEVCSRLAPGLFNNGAFMTIDGWRSSLPAGWQVKSLRRLLDGGLANGVFKKRDEFGNGMPLVNVGDLYQPDFQINPTGLERVSITLEEYQRFSVAPGDLFFVRSSLKEEGVAVSAVATEVPEPMVFECHVVRARPDKGQVDARFLSFWLNSTICRQMLRCRANTTTMTTIDQDGLLSVPVPVPPLARQKAIVEELELLFDTSSKLMEVARTMQERLREYRSSLISAAVTGQLDINSFE